MQYLYTFEHLKMVVLLELGKLFYYLRLLPRVSLFIDVL